MQRIISSIYCLLLAVVLVGASSLLVFAADGQIKIAQTSSTTFPIVINKSGSYVLTSNLKVTDANQHAIRIDVNDVSLDLNGHTIQGPNALSGTGAGIYSLGHYNISVKNGRIWGFSAQGILLVSSVPGDPNSKGAGHSIEGVQIVNNADGIVVEACLVTNCIANNNKLNCGICVDNSIIRNCVANNNQGDGIVANNSTVTSCTAHYNERAGIKASEDCYIKGNDLRNNNYGLFLSDFDESGNPLIPGYGNYAIQNVASNNATMNYNIIGTITFTCTPPLICKPSYCPLTGDNANYGF